MDDSATREFQHALNRTQFLPPERMLIHQRGLLEKRIRHARIHVPFYRDSGRLDVLFRTNDTIDWDQWRKVPLLRRKDVQQAGTSMRAGWMPPEHGANWTLSTSGSTGEPVRIAHSHLAGRTCWTAQMLQVFEQHRIDPTCRLLRAAIIPEKSSGSRTLHAEAWFPGFPEIGLRGSRVDVSNSSPANLILKVLLAQQPRYIWAAPTVLDLVCEYDRDRCLRRLHIGAVLMVGEALTPQMKQRISEHLGCTVVDMYMSNECGMIAASCPECGRMHVHSEVNYVEILDEAGTPVHPGATGWVVVTPLYNYAMPLIRYDHADRAKVGFDGICSSTRLALNQVVGKEVVPFVFRDGTTIRPRIDPDAIIECLGASSFQVAQVSEDRCEFRFTPGRLRPDQMPYDKLTAMLRRTWWPELRVDYRVVTDLHASERSKLKLYVRENSTGTVRRDPEIHVHCREIGVSGRVSRKAVPVLEAPQLSERVSLSDNARQFLAKVFGDLEE